MNILFIKHFFVGCMVSEIPRVSAFGYFPLVICGLNLKLFVCVFSEISSILIMGTNYYMTPAKDF